MNECLLIWQSGDTWKYLSFDAVSTEVEKGASVVTKYPVDSGFLVSDHTIRQNKVIQLDAVITTSTHSASRHAGVLNTQSTFEAIVSMAGLSADMFTSAPFGGSATAGRSKILEAFEELRMLNQQGLRVHLATAKGIHPDCVLVNYVEKTTKKTLSSLALALVFEQLVVIDAPSYKSADSVTKTEINNLAGYSPSTGGYA